MRHRAAAVLLLALLGLILPRPLAAQTPPSDEALVAAIDELAAKALKEPTAVGLSIAVARGDRILLAKGYGKANLEHDIPATEKTLFRIGSVTKQYTAAAIMKLAEQGKLSLDDDFTKHVPYPTQGHTVTIRQLLNHTSGIKSYTDLPDFFKTGSANDLTPAAVLDPVRALPFDFEPGTKWAYNNSGYHLLGMIIEKVSGQPYAEHLQREYLAPLGLTQTRYDVTGDIIPARASGYTRQGGKLANAQYLSMTIPYAAGGLMATASDLIRWQLALTSGKAVSVDSYAQMTTSTKLPSGTDTQYGFGLAIDDAEGHPRIHHGGGINGFTSELAHYPKDNLSVAVISNCDGFQSGRLAQQIAMAALGIKTPEAKDLALPAAELEALTGHYRIDQLKMDLAVTVADGKLVVQATGQPAFPVLAQGNGEFRASFDHSVKLVFDPAAGETAKSPSFTLHQGGFTFKALRQP